LSYAYAGYFLPIYALNITLLTPIIIAFIFENFRDHRSELMIMDQIKQREALFACFTCIDKENTMNLTFMKFAKLLETLYPGRVEEAKLRFLFNLLDTNRSGTLVSDQHGSECVLTKVCCCCCVVVL
jgi:hypothetical protein